MPKPRDYSVFEEFITRCGQQQTDTEQVDPGVVPDQLQTGQTVYDMSGKEFTVLEPDAGTGQKNIMPSDQQGQQVPSGVKQVTDDELSSSYTIQPMTTAKRAQEEEAVELHWNDFQDIVNEMQAAIQAKDAKRLMEAAEDFTDMLLNNVSVPDDTDVSQAFRATGSVSVHPAFRKAQSGDVLSFEEPVRFDVERDSEDQITMGEGGFTDCMNRLKGLLVGKYPVTDVVLTLGEEFPREMVQKVLNEARGAGLF